MSQSTATPMPVPPWMAMVQAHADQAETVLAARATTPALPAIAALTFNADRTAAQHLIDLNRGRRAGVEQTSRDIANDTYQDVMGVRHRPATHRKESDR